VGVRKGGRQRERREPGKTAHQKVVVSG